MRLLKRQPLNYRVEATWQSNYQTRFDRIICFMGGIYGPVLDVGPANPFGRRLAERLCVDITNTHGNLDGVWHVNVDELVYFPVVWCFEVIEHLKNPDMFLRDLRDYCNTNTRIFLTYPHRTFRIFWTSGHFHEIAPDRFRELITSAGYDIVRYKHYWYMRPWWFYLTGIRPFLRLIVGRCHHHYYELKLK